MNHRLQSGLQFRIREHPTCRKLGLSTHVAKGVVTFVGETHISFIVIKGTAHGAEIMAHCSFEKFQIYFSIIPFDPIILDAIVSREALKIFPDDFEY